MPDPTLSPDIRTGFDSNAIFDMKMDTFKTMNNLLSQYDNPYLPTGPISPSISIPSGLTYMDALQSPDPKIRDLGITHLEQETQTDPYYQLGLGNEIRTPYDRASKYIDKKFGFDAQIPDIEDYYYRNDYMADGWFKRNLVMNPLRFMGRVLVPSVLKLLEGVGYVGSMIKSIGSSNYWADVADNAFSKWLENQEQTFKDKFIPIYHQAGFDQKGFFSRMTDAAFWNEDVADGIAFMASAAIPSMGIAKLGTIGAIAAEGEEAVNWFGRAFSATSKIGKISSNVGLGSFSELSSWTLNTAMEAAMEGSQTFHTAVDKMKQLRARGIGKYADMTDEDIRSAAGSLAANDVGANFMILGLSNAWENTLFFAPFKNEMPRLKLGEDFIAQGSKKGLSRLPFYGKIAAEGFLAEGLWEENAQLAVQRMNTLDDQGNFVTGNRGFFSQLGKQTWDAFSGNDPEAMQNIGVGGLIGILGGIGFAKVAGERKELLEKIDHSIDQSKSLKNDLFSLIDIYQKDKDNNIIFENNKPLVDQDKIQIRKKHIEDLFKNIQISNIQGLENNTAADLLTKQALGQYISSLYKMGIKDVSARFSRLNPEQAAIFGINNASPRDKAGEYGTFAKKVEQEVIRTSKENLVKPTEITTQQYIERSQAALSDVYDARILKLILNEYILKEESKMLAGLNASRSLTNTSISAFPVEEINSLLYQLQATRKIINDPLFKNNLSEPEQKFHLNREKSLVQQIENYKTENASFLDESRQDNNGFYVAQYKTADGKLVDAPIDKASVTSNQKRANYLNLITQANWKESNLLSKNWHFFYEGLKEIPIIKEIKSQLAAEQKAFNESIFAKYKEHNPDDFKGVVRLVGKILSGKTEFSPEEQQLRQNYSELIEKLIPQYEDALAQETKNIFLKKLQNYTLLRDNILSTIFEKKYKIGELSISAQELTKKLLNSLKDNRIEVEELQTLIYSTQKAIDELEESVKNDEKTLADLDRKLTILEQETQAGDFQGIRDTTAELRKERDWVENEIKEKQSLLDKLIALIKSITNIAYKLFANTKGNYFVSRKQFEENLSKGRFEAVESFNEIALRTLEKNALEQEINDLQKVFTELGQKIDYYQDIINQTEQAVLNNFDNQLKALTKQSEIVQSSTEEQKTTDSFQEEFGTPPLSTEGERFIDDFDGPDYIRPLATKFITSTFSDRRVFDSDGNVIASDYSSLSDSEKDHFHLMDYLSSGKNTAEINKKLDKGKLKIIAVTQHNIDMLGLKDLLYTKTEKNDQAQYWEDKNPATARIDFVHVIEKRGKLFFVDKELNILGEIGKVEDKDKSKIARTIMRAAKFSSKEESQYDLQNASNKNWEADKKKAIEYGIEQRKSIIDNSKKFTLDKPVGVFEFDITRGVPVRALSVNGKVHNAVTDVLMTPEQITGSTIVVSTGKYTLNGSPISLPKGKAFIKTGGIYEKLHYADNNKLDESTVNTILAVFDKLSAAYVAKLEEVMAKQLNGKKLSDLSSSDKMKMIVTFNKSTKNTFNKSYMNYLSSVIYFGLLEKNEVINSNKVYLKGAFIHFGDVKIDISNGGFTTNEGAKKFLLERYHNVRHFSDTKKANKEFIEYYLDNEELKERKWKTYNHYLLSKNFPDGTVRTFIPITTQIHTKEQANQESNSPEENYTSQSVILSVPYFENIKKKDIIDNSPVEEGRSIFTDEGNLNIVSETSVKDLLADKEAPKEELQTKPEATSNLMKELRKRSQNVTNVVEAAAKTEKGEKQVSAVLLQKLLKMKKAKENGGEVTERTEPIPETEDQNVDWDSNESAFRLITKTGPFKTEKDLESVIEYAQKVLPQFPVERLKKAIQVSPTVQAFGQFTGDAIRLWEGAEQGTLYHEIFEGVVNRILTDYEWNSIAKEFKSRKGTFIERETGEIVAYSKATPQQIKEEIAEEFRTFKMTGKVFEGAKNTRTFFQVILDFIKKLFGAHETIKGLFKNIDESKLSQRGIRGANRFTENYRKKVYPIPYRKYNEFLQGFTAYMFRDIFESPESIVKLDEVGEIDQKIYDRIRAKIDDTYIAMLEEFAAGTFPTNTPNMELNEINRQKEKALEIVIANWDKIKENWADFVADHKIYLHKFRIKFDENYQLQSDEENMSNRNDYTGNPFSVSNKNSSSLSVRFMVGTLFKSVVKSTKDGKYTIGSNPIFPNLQLKYSNSRLPQLENYDKMMAKVSFEFSNLNDMTLIEKKMKRLSGITRLEEAKDIDEQQQIAKELTNEEAGFTLLYARLFSPKKTISEEAMWNLRTKFLAYTSKQSPIPYILMMNDGTGISLIQSTNRSSYEKFHKRLRAAMNRNIGLFFSKNTKNGITTYTPKTQTITFNANAYIGEKSKEKEHFTKFLQFLGLYTPATKNRQERGILTPQFMSTLKDNNLDKYRELVTLLHKTAEKLQTVKAFTGAITVGNLDIFGYTNQILALLDEIRASQSERLMTHLDINNNSTQNYISPSFVSRILSEMSNVDNLAELIEAYPHLKQHITFQDGKYITDSIMINKMFNEDGTRKAHILSNLSYIEGIKISDDAGRNNAKKTSQLEYHQRLGLQFTLSLSGFYNALTADSETEWAFNMGEFVPFEEYIESDENGKNKIGEVVSEFYLPKLAAEISLALNFNSKNQQMNSKHKDIDRVIGKSLRFFKDILQFTKNGKTSRELIDKIHKAIDEGKQPSQILARKKDGGFREEISEAIKQYIQHSTIDTLNNLLQNRVISELDTTDGVTYVINDLTTSLSKKFGDRHSLTNIRDIVMYATVNSQLANFEQFKLIYGDVAQYKDWEKRAKSMFGPIEQAYFDKTGEFNKWLNINKNYAEFEGQRVSIPETDVFNTSFKNHLVGRTVDDIMTKNPELLNLLEEMVPEEDKKNFSAYYNTNEVDGQSIANLQAFRQLMIKAAWRWTSDFEEFFQYDTALARQELSAAGGYKYSSEELRALDQKIVEKYKDNPPLKGPSPVKTLIPFVRPDGNFGLMKHSVYPNSWQLARDHHELKSLYVRMLNRGDDIINFKSAHKVGADLDNSGKITSHYKRFNNNGVESFSPFEITDLDEAGNVQYEMSFRTMGIQVETQGNDKKQRIGSQLTKDIYLNLMPNGVPADFRNNNRDLTEEQYIQKWQSLSEDEKMQSKDYRQVQDTIQTLKNLKDKSVMDTFDRIGIAYTYENGEFKYSSVDLIKLQKHILDEMTRLDIDENVINGLELTEDKDAFLHASESLPSYSVVSNIIWALSDKAISALKVNGVPYIQVSSAFFNDSQREATYFDGKKWVRVDNKEDFDRLQAEGKELMLTSSDLKFYTLEKDGKETQGMEIKLPHIYRSKINAKRRQKGLPVISDEELMNWLNKPENSKLLEGIGFRIPTQATSSIEFFKIKGFLPESFGKSVVVPSDITAKAGSDFDVDKLQTYLNNWRLNKKGMPEFERFMDDSNSTAKERYDYVYGKRREFLRTIEKILQDSYEKEILKPADTGAAGTMMDKIFGDIDNTSFYTDDEIKELLKEKGFDVDYNQLLKEVQEEIKNSPKFEDFEKLPIHLQNSRGAVENEYFRSIRDILKQPERFLQLLSPNNMDNIKENRDTVMKAINPDYKPEEKKDINYSNFLDMNYLSDKRHSFIRGKYDIAIFAVSMTNYANSQITGLGITEGQVRPEDRAVMQAVGYDISLPFEEAPLLSVNGWDFIPLGYARSADGRYIMDKISGYINGAVDVAKDPVIIEMGMHSDLANVYMLLERAGIKGKNIALFLMQPSIRDYLIENIYRKNPQFGISRFQWKKEVIGYVLDKYSVSDNMEYEKVQFTEEQLTHMLRKGEKIKKEQQQAQENLRNGKPAGKITEWTDEEKRLQWLAFVNFLKMEVFANNLNDIRTSSNHDTSGIRSIYSLIRKDLIRDRTYEGNMIMAPKSNGFVNGVDAIREGTFVQRTIDLLNMFNDVFSNTNLFALQKSNPKDTLDKITRRIYKRNPYMREDDFIAIMKEYDAAIIDSLLNNYAKIGNTPIAALKKQFFLPTESVGLEVRYSHNLNTRWESIKTNKKFDKLRAENFFLSNLSIEYDDVLGVYTIDLLNTFSFEDTLSRNLIINGWRDILEHPDDEIFQFAKALLYGTIIQYGVKTQRNSMTPLIPLEYYSMVSDPVIEKIQEADFSNFDEEVVRENAYKKNFVKQEQPMAMDYLDATGNIITIWSERKEEDRKLGKRPSLSQRLFVRNMGTGELRKYFGEEAIHNKYKEIYGKDVEEIPNDVFRNLFSDEIKDVNTRMISRPVFMWKKYLDEDDDNGKILESADEYIAVKMPRPEYVILTEDNNGKIRRRLSKQAFEAMNKNDFKSWTFTQVYKLVGIDGTTPSVMRFKEGKGKVSVSLLYKPINSAGDNGFNEVANLFEDDNGNVTGRESILRSNIHVKEQTDEEIVAILRQKPGLPIKYVKKLQEEIKTEQEEPIAAQERIRRDLGITAGKQTPNQYNWAQKSKNSYEISTRGDKRFSALIAKLNKGTILDLPINPEYVMERSATIEEIYQVGIKGYESTKKGKGKPSLRPMTREEQWKRYKTLWEIFADQNPELMDELARKAKGKVLTDQFADTDINQARALAEILNERNQSSPQEEITPTC